MARPKTGRPTKEKLSLSVTKEIKEYLTQISESKKQSISELVSQYAEREIKKINNEKTIKNSQGTTIDYNIAENFMDEELREEIHREIAPCTKQEFFNEYAKQHKIKFNETWELDKENPCY